MQRPNILAVTLLTGGMLLATAQAQTPASTTTQTPSAGSQTTPTAKKPAATSTPKTGATTGTKTAAPLVLKTPKDKASYAIGQNIGKAMKKDSVDIDPTILARGIKDAVTGAKPALTDQEAQAALQAFQIEMKAKMEAKAAEMGSANKAGRRRVPGAEQSEARRHHNRERATVQGVDDWHRTEAQRQRHRNLPIPRHFD